MNWKTQAAAAIVAPPAPAPSEERPFSADAVLAEKLQAALHAGSIEPRSVDFARSLLNGYLRYRGFTDRQRPHVERLVAVSGAPKPAAPHQPLADALRAALPLLGARDAEFASSLLAGFDRWGGFTDKQIPWVEKLAAAASAPAPAAAPAAAPSDRVSIPRTAALFGPSKFAGFEVGDLTYKARQDFSVVWLQYQTRTIGRLDPATGDLRLVSGWPFLPKETRDELLALINKIEQDPRAAAEESGRLTGRCSCCSRPLVNPDSIAAGIGPICASRF